MLDIRKIIYCKVLAGSRIEPNGHNMKHTRDIESTLLVAFAIIIFILLIVEKLSNGFAI